MKNNIKNIIDITIKFLSSVIYYISVIYIYMIKDNKQAINGAIGLTKAYEDGDTHIIGNTMYIAGTHTKKRRL